jgi:hypothetical protein
MSKRTYGEWVDKIEIGDVKINEFADMLSDWKDSAWELLGFNDAQKKIEDALRAKLDRQYDKNVILMVGYDNILAERDAANVELAKMCVAGDEMAEALELGCSRDSNDIVDIIHLDLVNAWRKAKEKK